MKATVDRELLSRAMAACNRVVKHRSPAPIMQCFLIRADEDAIRVSAYDGLTWVEADVAQAKVDKPGRVAVVADKVSSLVSRCNAESLELSVDNGVLVVEGGGRFEFGTMDAAQFHVPQEPTGELGTVEASLLADAIKRVTWASTSNVSSKHALNGMCIVADSAKARCFSTNGRAMSCSTLPMEVAQCFEVVVTLDGTKLLSNLLDDGDVMMHSHPSGVRFTGDGWRAVVPVPEGDTVSPASADHVLNMNIGTTCVIDSADWLRLANTMGVFAQDEVSASEIKVEGDKLTMTAYGPDGGYGSSSVPITELKGDPICADYRTQLIQSMLGGIPNGDLTLGFANGKHAFIRVVAGDVTAMVANVARIGGAKK